MRMPYKSVDLVQEASAIRSERPIKRQATRPSVNYDLTVWLFFVLFVFSFFLFLLTGLPTVWRITAWRWRHRRSLGTVSSTSFCKEWLNFRHTSPSSLLSGGKWKLCAQSHLPNEQPWFSFQCYFTSTYAIRLISDREPRTTTSTFTQLQSYVTS